MENYEDDFSESNIDQLVIRFEKMVEDGGSLYYEVDELEELLEHYIINQRVELAFRVIGIAGTQYPGNKQLAIKEAELLSITGKHEEALELLSEIELLESFNPDYYLAKATVLSQGGNYKNAIDSLFKALEFARDEHDLIYLNLAIEYQNMEDYPRAIEFLKKSLTLNYDSEDALYELAYCFELSRNYDDAVLTFNKIIDHSPYNAHAWFNLGASYQALGQFEKALVALDYVLIIDEDFHAAYFNKAMVLVKLERYSEAIELYKRALSFEILDSLIYFYIGDCYDNLEDYKNALLYFEKAIKKDAAMAEGWIGASSSLDMLERELEALEYAKRAVEIDNKNGDYWCFLAGLEMKYDLPYDAVNSFEKAIEMGYLLEDVWEDYAQLCLTLKDQELAKSVVDRGQAIHAENKLLQVYRSIIHYRDREEDMGFELLVQTLMQEPKLIEEFILFYPQAMELEEIQFLIESMK